MSSYASHFSRFLGAVPGRLHVAAHSHHPWPDVTFAAQEQAWLDAPMPFLGGQQANRVYVEASKQVSEGWQYTPFQDYTESVFPDTIGQALANHTDVQAGLNAWGERLRTYATEQGFQVQGS